MKHKTFVPKLNTLDKKWYIIDAKGLKIGKLSTFAARVLMGKDKSSFVSFLNCGDNLIIINASSLYLQPSVLDSKQFYRYTGYPGGLRPLSLGDLMKKNPSLVVEHSIKGMLPKNKLGDDMMSHLHVYNEDVHPHSAQKPEQLTLPE